MKIIGLIQIVSFALLCSAIGMTYSFSWRFVTLLWWFVITQSLEIALTLIFLRRSGIQPVPFFPSGSWLLLKTAAPVGITYLVGALILRADTIVLAAISSRADVGRFAAANIGIVFAYAVAWLLGTVLLADQVGLARIPSEAFSYIQNWRKVLLLVILPSSLALCWLAPRIVRILYGGGFESTGLLASIMVLAVPFILLNATYLSRAIALGAKWVYLGSYIGTAVVAVPLDLALGRAYGSTGVAIAIVLREVLMFLAFFVFDPRSPEISPALEGNVTARRELELWQP